MPVTVAIVEDNAGICEELQHVVAQAADLQCVCVCRNAESALRRLPAARPHVIIMDINLPDGSGIECTMRVKRLLPDTQILMFTIADEADTIVKALEAGASGYLLKSTHATGIVAAIHEVVSHGAPLSRDIARKLVERFHKAPTHAETIEPLTPREEEILLHLSRGLLYKEIGEHLGIKIDTVGSHVKNIYRKLQVRTRTEAVVKYLR